MTYEEDYERGIRECAGCSASWDLSKGGAEWHYERCPLPIERNVGSARWFAEPTCPECGSTDYHRESGACFNCDGWMR